jgi:hypothetical protein
MNVPALANASNSSSSFSEICTSGTTTCVPGRLHTLLARQRDKLKRRRHREPSRTQPTGARERAYIEFHQQLDIDKVCDIFTQIDSRGVQLDTTAMSPSPALSSSGRGGTRLRRHCFPRSAGMSSMQTN